MKIKSRYTYSPIKWPTFKMQNVDDDMEKQVSSLMVRM